MITDPDVQALTTVPEIEGVDALLQFLDDTELTDEQKLVIPHLWFSYSVNEASLATGISRERYSSG